MDSALHYDPDEMIDTVAAAALLGRAAGTLANDRNAGRDGPPFHRFGRSVRYRRGDVLAYRDGKRIESATERRAA